MPAFHSSRSLLRRWRYNRLSVHLERIAELLAPFLSGAIDTNLPAANVYRSENQNSCHFEECGDEQPAVLTSVQLQNISTYIDILLRWNARINLTSIRDPEQIVTRHFGESLFAARRLFPGEARTVPVVSGRGLEQIPIPRSTDGLAGFNMTGAMSGVRSDGGEVHQGRVTDNRQAGTLAPENRPNAQSSTPKSAPTLADVGSGAGFPGIPIKLWAPEVSLTLIESSHKKAAFLGEVIRTLILTHINVQNTRAESFANSRFDVVTLRAVERFDAILPVAARLIAPAGRLALLIGASQLERTLAVQPGLSWSPPMPIPLSDSRILLVGNIS